MKIKLTLSVDKILVDEAKRRGLNISGFLEGCLSRVLCYKKLSERWVKL